MGLMGWDGWDWDTVSSVIEEYLRSSSVLGVLIIYIFEKKIFFEIKTHFSYFIVLGIGSSLRKRQRQIIKALLKVVCRHLTPPPSSTNVEKLFSYGGLVATDHRSSLPGKKLDQILFLRENALMANFDLGYKKPSFVFELQRQ